MKQNTSRNIEEARMVANRYFATKNNKKYKIGPILYPRDCQNKLKSLYVFSILPCGFIIVSGDKRTHDILGYSFESNLDIDKLSESMSYLLKQYNSEIDSLD
ncbi:MULTISPECIES: Spi family protease inhibitor [Enterococcus]|nr:MULTISPECIES: Spi family protease inhibitor [Enterococcus]